MLYKLTDRTVTDWRMQLNNYLQVNGGTRMLEWEVYSVGPPHNLQWTAITYSMCYFTYALISELTSYYIVRGIEYARCVGSKQGQTMETAARQTLDALFADRTGRY